MDGGFFTSTLIERAVVWSGRGDHNPSLTIHQTVDLTLPFFADEALRRRSYPFAVALG